MQSLVSFIIPVFNEEKRISMCLERILEQSDCNIEIICIDDNSTDNSFEILSRYADTYSNIQVFRNVENKGAAYSRNLGIDYAQGKYVWFIDADDYIEENVLKEIIRISEENKLDVLCFDIKRRDFNGNDYISRYLSVEGHTVMQGQELYCKICAGNRIRASVYGQLYRTQYLKSTGIRFREGEIAEDAYYSMKALIMAERTQYIPKVCYVYYNSEDSVTKRTSDERYFTGILAAYHDMLQFWNSIEENELLKKCMLEFIGKYYKLAKKYFLTSDKQKVELLLKSKKDIYDTYQLFVVNENTNLYLPDLKGDKIEIINRYEEIIIYGAGRVARELALLVDKLEKRIVAYAVSANQKNNPKSIYGVPVVEIEELLQYGKTALVIIAIIPENSQGIYEGLQERGFKNILKIN